MKALIDTCVLINLFNENGNYHESARQCIEFLQEKKCLLIVSPLSLAEYGIKGSIADIVHSKLFASPSYGVRAAMQAAEFAKLTASDDAKQTLRTTENARKIIAIDTQIIAHAACEDADYILTADANTFAQTARYIKTRGKLLSEIVVLGDGALKQLQDCVSHCGGSEIPTQDVVQRQGELGI